MKYGDKIFWTYEHHLNSKSSTFITKKGEFISLIKHNNKWVGEQLALVQFSGNKKPSRVPLYDLHKIIV